MVFLAVAVAMGLVWAVGVGGVPLLPTNLYVPLLDLGKITCYTWPAAGLYLAMVLLLYVLYAIGYRAVARGELRAVWIFVTGAIYAAALVFAYPATAVDIFSYVAAGRLLALHQVNPFVAVPNAYPS